ncbi:DNA-binding transcriptional regulator, MarR family [Actinacidiphila yanglinensis]|uniref:DNA-binding transcriptional regulator, MarR family n=1 Tax=Actinacidiphila yanglinensis TaxID=310779 RepID=A0A1H6DT35_9ACTN|nr:MarR family transcriptional regulator [Actinacidiphila yanglinensis]SEG88552.1 DNA-binding transcriptional regulator, MarR family [Actinacidiphila yanglinensis]
MGATTEVPEEEYLCTRIRQTEQALTAHHEAVLRRYGLAMTQYAVLLALSREDGRSGAQLARACGVTQQSMAGVLTNLGGKGLISRAPSPAHAKVQLTSLTPDGRALLDRVYGEVDALEKELAAAFSPAERTALCDLLDRATAALRRGTPR